MERIRKLIREALSNPPKKKDCDCGGDCCKSPSLTESKELPNGDVYLGQDDKGNHKVKSNDKVTLYNNEDMVLIYGKGWGHNLNESYDYDSVAQAEFGMDYDQLGPGEQEWVRDEIDNMSMNENKGLK